MLAALAIAAAVAGGNLVVTTAPERPRPGREVQVRATGQVGDTGRLWIYRSATKCPATVSEARSRAVKLASLPITESFDFELAWKPRRAGTVWVCGYLYAITCDAAGRDCGPAVGLPPDAGFSQARVRVRPRSHSVKSAAGSGRVIT